MEQRELHGDDDGGRDHEAQKKAHEAGEKTAPPWMT
jgi:hypothetical protein